MSSCPECDGMGTIVLFTSAEPCGACEGTGQMGPSQAETLAQGNTAEGSDLWIRNSSESTLTFTDAYESGSTISTGAAGGDLTFTAGTGGSGGNVTIIGGDATSGTGVGGTITLRSGAVTGAGSTENITISGTSSSTTLTLNQSAMSLASNGGPQIDFYTGSSDPRANGPTAPLGSLYMRDDGDTGSLWVKVTNDVDGWSQLSTATPTTTFHNNVTFESEGDVARAVQSVLDAPDKAPVMEWATRKFTAFQQAYTEYRNTGELKTVEGILDTQVPVVAPMSSAVLADMMALLEQEGHEVEAFVSSSRDFADIRKFATGEHVRWEGKNVLVYGVPFLHSHKIPTGYMGAVSTKRLMCLANITR